MPPAERKELRIAFDVRDEAEHLVGAVRHISVGQEIRHRSFRSDRIKIVTRHSVPDIDKPSTSESFRRFVSRASACLPPLRRLTPRPGRPSRPGPTRWRLLSASSMALMDVLL